MKNKVQAAAVLSLAICLSHWVAVPALACSCVPPTATGAAKSADAIFSGEVIGIKYLDDAEGKNPEPRMIVKFKVIRTWRHVTSHEFFIHTVRNAWSCSGFDFREGQKYLVYAHRNAAGDAKRFAPYELPEESFGVGLCSRTMLLGYARGGGDLDVLGEGKAPAEPPPGPPPTTAFNRSRIKPDVLRTCPYSR